MSAVSCESAHPVLVPIIMRPRKCAFCLILITTQNASLFDSGYIFRCSSVLVRASTCVKRWSPSAAGKADGRRTIRESKPSCGKQKQKHTPKTRQDFQN
eukprot:c20524_g1_i1 orf=525-821(+)